ncbi:MAG: DUF4139 domain-containing protein [Rhodobacter sp.]|nr:DUF4139 domain-containing protein [Rhodobacter sp.]
MHFTFSLAAVFLSTTAAFADDILVRADIAEATIFLSGGELTRRATVTIPAGDHRIFIAMRDAADADQIAVTGPDSVTLGPPQLISGYAISEGALDDIAEAEARNAVTAAEDALQAAEDELAKADGAIRALELQMAFLSALSRGDDKGAAMPDDPALVPELLTTLGTETVRVEAELQTARVARRDLAEAVTDRKSNLAAARQAFARLKPFGTAVDVIQTAVRAEAATEAALEIGYLTGGAGWEPSYEWRLESESGAIEIARFITVYADSAARWQDVTTVFSTAEPSRQRVPTTLSPTPARIVEPASPRPVERSQLGVADFEVAVAEPAPMAEPVIVDERTTLEIEGLSLRYVYGEPVSLDATGEAVLPFEPITLQAETEARAIPRHDQTAFLVAIVENESGEPLLPGKARFYRDEALIGEDWLPLIAAGEEAEVGFGPLDHLRLEWIDRTLAEGDRGIFTTENTQVREIAFGVENTSDVPETARLLYATPFSEQEDLGLKITLAPEPDERDVDDRRGVHAWILEVDPGETDLVEMRLEFDWPDGQVLNWRP